MVHGGDWRRISLRQTTANSILDELAKIRLSCFRPLGMWQEVSRILYFELELDSGNDLAAHATSLKLRPGYGKKGRPAMASRHRTARHTDYLFAASTARQLGAPP